MRQSLPLIIVFMVFLELPGAAQCQLQKVAPTGGPPCEIFGKSVAMEGNRLVVGGSAAKDDPPLPCATGPGSVNVFEIIAGSWVQTKRLVPADGGEGDEFGNSVDLSGSRIIVGAEHHDGAAGSNSGAAYIFYLVGGSWEQEAKLAPTDAESGQYFARSVSISGDLVVCGTRFDKDLGNQAGAAYVFQRTAGGDWVELQKLKASDGGTKDLFGNAVAIDGTTIVVGAYFKDGLGGNKSGVSYVYELVGSKWEEVARIEPMDSESNAEFGRSVAISGDRVLIGARSDDSTGSAYIFDRDPGTGVWSESSKLVPSDGTGDDYFGNSCDLDGDTAIVGADRHSPPSAGGAAYIYKKEAGGWVEFAKLTPNDIASGDHFGMSVAASANTAVGGAPFDLGANGSAAVFSIGGSGAVAALETPRLGDPPNPSAFLPGVASGPVVGSTWDPVIDHTTFLPDAILDFVAVGVIPTNIPTPLGAALCGLTPPIVVAGTPGTPFAFPLTECAHIGLTLCTQGASVNAVLKIELTNALDITLGSH